MKISDLFEDTPFNVKYGLQGFDPANPLHMEFKKIILHRLPEYAKYIKQPLEINTRKLWDIINKQDWKSAISGKAFTSEDPPSVAKKDQELGLTNDNLHFITLREKYSLRPKSIPEWPEDQLTFIDHMYKDGYSLGQIQKAMEKKFKVKRSNGSLEIKLNKIINNDPSIIDSHNANKKYIPRTKLTPEEIAEIEPLYRRGFGSELIAQELQKKFKDNLYKRLGIDRRASGSAQSYINALVQKDNEQGGTLQKDYEANRAAPRIDWTDKEMTHVKNLYKNGYGSNSISTQISQEWGRDISQANVDSLLGRLTKQDPNLEAEYKANQKRILVPRTKEETDFTVKQFEAGKQIAKIRLMILDKFNVERSHSGINNFLKSFGEEIYRDILLASHMENREYKDPRVSIAEEHFFERLARDPEIPKISRNQSYDHPNARYKYNLDGVHKNPNVIIEFYGDLYHANPLKYPDDNQLLTTGVLAGDVRAKDKRKEDWLRSKGNTVVIVWENQWSKKKEWLNIFNSVRKAFGLNAITQKQLNQLLLSNTQVNNPQSSTA